jgi:tetratricopeptide (TPR) repeat protein
MPGAGHLVHMPAHTYIRTGRYADAAEANRRAIRAEQAYVARANPQGFYLMYVAHNPQFLWAATLLQGRAEESLAAARQTVGIMPHEMLREMPGFDFTLGYPIWTLVRFGRWDEVLAEPAPPADFAYATAGWHAARGLAHVGKGELAAGERELAAFRTAAAAVPEDALEGLNSARVLLTIAEELLAGKLAVARGDVEGGIARLTAAAQAEDGLRYNEPPDWYLPVRHALGAVLLAAGRAAEAQAVYEHDLRARPENGWALRGLADSLRAQGKTAEAAAVERRFATAWSDADVEITRSWW